MDIPTLTLIDELIIILIFNVGEAVDNIFMNVCEEQTNDQPLVPISPHA